MEQILPLATHCHAIKMLAEDCPLPRLDLVVTPDRLVTPTGKRLHRKRSLLRQFYDGVAMLHRDRLSSNNLDLAYTLERQWQTNAEDGQQAFVRRCFRSFGELGLCGILLRDGNTAIGYSIATECEDTGGYILVLRALPSPAGTTAALYRETALLLQGRQPGLAAINLGWLGGEQEQQNRLSYQPMQIGQE